MAAQWNVEHAGRAGAVSRQSFSFMAPGRTIAMSRSAPIRPFRDLAGGLASHGVAVLRYDKRNYIHAPKIDSRNSRSRKKCSTMPWRPSSCCGKRRASIPGAVYVLGHSLGGDGGAEARGYRLEDRRDIILLAGAARPLEDVVIDQLTYIGSLPGPNGEGAKEMLPKMKEQLARVKDPQTARRKCRIAKSRWGCRRSIGCRSASLDPAPTAGKLNCRDTGAPGRPRLPGDARRFRALRESMPANRMRHSSDSRTQPLIHGRDRQSDAGRIRKVGHVAPEVIDTIAGLGQVNVTPTTRVREGSAHRLAKTPRRG